MVELRDVALVKKLNAKKNTANVSTPVRLVMNCVNVKTV
jgi:hypothetical protein